MKCPNKNKYTKKEAETQRNAQLKRGLRRTKSNYLEVYECPYCKYWHLSHRGK